MTPEQEQLQHTELTNAHDSYAKLMQSYSFFKVHNHATSEDLVQDTFIKTWSYIVKGGKIEIMKAFLYHVLNQLIIDEYRKRKTSSLDSLLEKGWEPSFDNSEQMFNIFDGKVALLLIKQLPTKYQKVIQMRYVQDLSLKEIALLTGQSKNAATVQIHRGIEKLKVLYYRPAPSQGF